MKTEKQNPFRKGGLGLGLGVFDPLEGCFLADVLITQTRQHHPCCQDKPILYRPKKDISKS